MDSGWPAVSDMFVDLPVSGEWGEFRINVAELILSGNSSQAGAADLGAIINPLVFQASGSIDFFVKNIRIE
jgi:hypothetical protein